MIQPDSRKRVKESPARASGQVVALLGPIDAVAHRAATRRQLDGELLQERMQPMRITRITLRPRIRLAAGGDLERALRLVDRAHDACFVANSLRTEIDVEVSIATADES